jgi:hypothetical protein
VLGDFHKVLIMPFFIPRGCRLVASFFLVDRLVTSESLTEIPKREQMLWLLNIALCCFRTVKIQAELPKYTWLRIRILSVRVYRPSAAAGLLFLEERLSDSFFLTRYGDPQKMKSRPEVQRIKSWGAF